MPGCVSYSRTTSTLAAFAAALALAGAAQAADGSVKPNYQFGDGSHGFRLQSHGGAVNPGIFVGFDPQPDPPGEDSATLLDLTDGTSPTLFNPTGGGYRFQFYHTFGDGSVHPLAAPNADGFTSSRHFIGGHDINVTFQFGPGQVDPGSWVGFNPQPDPPGDGFAQEFNFVGGEVVAQGRGDFFVTFGITVDGEQLTFSAAPEPATWAMMILGFGGAGVVLRRRRTEPAVA
jgi:hypothetical protein